MKLLACRFGDPVRNSGVNVMKPFFKKLEESLVFVILRHTLLGVSRWGGGRKKKKKKKKSGASIPNGVKNEEKKKVKKEMKKGQGAKQKL